MSASDNERRTSVGLVQITGVNLPTRKEGERNRLYLEGRGTARSAATPRTGPQPVESSSRRSGGDQVFYSILPYSVGMLQAYAEAHAPDPQRFDFRLPLYSRHPPEEAADLLDGTDVVGFSAYIWNIRLSLAIAREIKQRRPETLIVFGGPQVPDRAESFLRENPFIDVVCHGEGERVFLELLQRVHSRDWDGVPSISFLNDDGTFETRPRIPRIDDMATVPSPYLSGVFDGLIARDPHEKWFPLWETNRGCPFRCTFCDWGSAIAGRVYRFPMERLEAEIAWFAEREMEFIYCCDANFGMLKRDLEIAESLVRSKHERKFPWWISLQNTKNATERSYAVQKCLSDAGMISRTGVTIALQSLDPTTLKSIKRDNISTDSFQELQRRFTRDGVETYTDMIIGLPGETYDSFLDGISDVIANGQHNRMVFFNCSILPNAEMGDPDYQKKYGMVTVPSRMLNNAYTSLAVVDDGIPEYIDTCIATASMPHEAWVRTKAFSWLVELLHFERLLQLTFVVNHETYGVSYRKLLEAFAGRDAKTHPVLADLWSMFLDKARDIQQGGTELYASKRWLNLLWPVSQMGLIRLVTEKRLEAFYAEAHAVIVELLQQQGVVFDGKLLEQTLKLNHSLLKVPFQSQDLLVECSYNVWEFYRSVLCGDSVALEQQPCTYFVERSRDSWKTNEHWCADLVRRQNTKSANLYSLRGLHEAKPQTA